MSLAWTSWAATDVGTVRSGNQDAFVDQPNLRLWAVADGAGGHEHGEVAAAALKKALETPFQQTGANLMAEIRARVLEVHQDLRRHADTESEQTDQAITIASTLVVFLAEGSYFACLWCGDSRAYLLRDNNLSQISRDHSLVQELVDAGMLNEAEAERHPHANVLTRAVGAEGATPDLDKITGRAQPGDRFLLCSDGLFKALEHDAILTLMRGPDPARELIAAALRAAARDNVTVIVIEAQTAEQGTSDDAIVDGQNGSDMDDDGTLMARQR